MSIQGKCVFWLIKNGTYTNKGLKMSPEIEYSWSLGFLVKGVLSHAWFSHRENNELVFLTKEQMSNFFFFS